MAHPARKFLPLVLLLASALLPHRLIAGVGEWTSSGPHGGTILNLAADPSNPSILYAATDRQVYKSVDGGHNWAFTLSGRFDILLPTSDPSVVYASSGGVPSVYVTGDGGVHWASHSTPVSGNPLIAVAVDPQNPRTLYAIVPVSSSISGLYRSTDGAESWTRIENPPASGVGMTAIAVDPADPAVFYVSVAFGTRSTGVYRSSNGGRSWTQTALKESSTGVQVDPRDPSRVFALGSSGLQMSTNTGASWRRIFPGSALQFPTLLAVDPVNTSRLYAVAGGVLFSSSDGGSSARRSEDEFGGLVQAIAVSPSGAVFAGSRTGVYRSEDAAVSWGEASRGISEIRVTSLAVDPTDSRVAFAGSANGIHETRDGGASWSRPTSTSPWGQVVLIDPTDHSTLYAAGNGVQKSTDGGRTWDRSSGLADIIYDLVMDPNNPRRLLASSWSVYRSSDGAESWHNVLPPDDNYSSYYYPPTVNALAIAPSASSTIYAGGQGYSATDGYQSKGFVYRSDDGGDHWTAMANAGTGINALAVDFCDPRIVQAAGYDSVYRSLDGGDSWTGQPLPWDSGLPPISGNILTLVRDPRHSSSIFAGRSDGIFWTNDRGTTWARFEPVLHEPIRSIALDSSGRFLYAGTEKGVFTLERTFEKCSNGPNRLCLLDGKYEVSVTARRRGTAISFPGHAIVEGDRFGYFSFPDVTGDPTFPEVFVKMLDKTNAPPPYGGSAWVFHSSLTDLDYTLTVREMESGRVRSYPATRSGSLSCGQADTTAFTRACEAAPASLAPESQTSFDSPSGAELSLLGGRFRATVRATDPRTGRVVDGAAFPRADGFGYFGLPGLTADPAFPEIFVKMADGRPNGGHFWVFHTGLTDLNYVLTIRDTRTGVEKTYSGGATNGTLLCGAADTSAF
jgi:photosystem II stability/assembly factor-like uncharacterized protein